MRPIRCYHGTRDVEAFCAAYHLGRVGQRCGRDPGDFGLGFYATTDALRARAYGDTLVVLDVDPGRFAHIPNPYFVDGLAETTPKTPEERLFHQLAFGSVPMGTVAGTKRRLIAQRIRETFVAHGYEGIVTDHHGDLVVFVQSAILCYRVAHEQTTDGSDPPTPWPRAG